VIRLPLCCLLAFHSSALFAAAADPLSDMRACATQTDDARRLACYDATMRGESSTPTTVASAAAAVAAPTAEEKFGYRGDVAREQLEQEEKKTQSAQLEQLVTQIKAVSWQPLGEFVVTLDNDQVWAQKRPESSVKPKVGDPVTIKPAALGSFLLVTKSGRSTRVARVK
jgi:cell pole-organizing protein PopZ